MCVPCVRPELHRGLLCAKSCGGLRGFQGQVNPPPPPLYQPQTAHTAKCTTMQKGVQSAAI